MPANRQHEQSCDVCAGVVGERAVRLPRPWRTRTPCRGRYRRFALRRRPGGPTLTTPMTTPDQYASVRYLVDDVQTAVDFYTTHLGFTVNTSAAPAFADVVRGPLRLLLSGPASSGARATPD